MPVEIKFTADTMDELWSMLSTFGQPRISGGEGIVGDVLKQEPYRGALIHSDAPMPGEGSAVLVPAPVKTEKRGPGRPKKTVTPTVDDGPDPDPESVPEGEEDTSPEEVKKSLSDALTIHWKQNIKAKKDIINAFKADIGIGVLAEMTPAHFAKARETLKSLDKMV